MSIPSMLRLKSIKRDYCAFATMVPKLGEPIVNLLDPTTNPKVRVKHATFG